MYVAVCALALGFTSCGADDVVDLACDSARDALKASVQVTINAYDAEPNAETCNAAKTAIEEYKANPCGDNSFDAVLTGLGACEFAQEV